MHCFNCAVLTSREDFLRRTKNKKVCHMHLCQKLSWLRASNTPSFFSLNAFSVYKDDAKRLCFTLKTGLDFTQRRCLTD